MPAQLAKVTCGDNQSTKPAKCSKCNHFLFLLENLYTGGDVDSGPGYERIFQKY